MQGYTVEPISYQEAKPWILKKHYAHRMPSVVSAFGLFNGMVVGVVTFGIPPNNNLNKLAGYGMLELNRLCIDDECPKNAASYLIGNALQMLPRPKAIISYADAGQGHIGYVYQATNWLYTGMGSGDTEYAKDGHQFHRKQMYNRFGTGSRRNAEAMGFEAVNVRPKHRYVYFLGNKKQKQAMCNALKYPILPYPKGESKRYDASAEFHKQVRLF